MAYTKTTWQDGDVITAAKLNNEEDGIAANDAAVTALGAELTTLAGKVDGKAGKVEEITIATDGDVVQALDANKIYHFTSTALTSLTITLNGTTDIPQYHFDFLSCDGASLNMPAVVIMPDGFEVEANKRYEVDILNGYGAVQNWSIA